MYSRSNYNVHRTGKRSRKKKKNKGSLYKLFFLCFYIYTRIKPCAYRQDFACMSKNILIENMSEMYILGKIICQEFDRSIIWRSPRFIDGCLRDRKPVWFDELNGRNMSVCVHSPISLWVRGKRRFLSIVMIVVVVVCVAWINSLFFPYIYIASRKRVLYDDEQDEQMDGDEYWIDYTWLYMRLHGWDAHVCVCVYSSYWIFFEAVYLSGWSM